MNNAMSATYPTGGAGGIGVYPGIGPLQPSAFGLKQHYPSDITLGERYRDDQTGFEGHATSVHFYQHACERVTLESHNKKLGMEEYTFDAKRLTHVESGEVVDAELPGGPVRAEGKRANPAR